MATVGSFTTTVVKKMERVQQEIINDAYEILKREVPVGEPKYRPGAKSRTLPGGALRDSIHVERHGKGRVRMGISRSKLENHPANPSGIDYSPFIIKGTQAHWVAPHGRNPRNPGAEALRFYDGKKRFSGGHEVSGIAPNNFLRRTADEVRKKWR